jgi:hypothetical protein
MNEITADALPALMILLAIVCLLVSQDGDGGAA